MNKKIKKYEKFIKSAIELFYKNGIEKTTVDMIAKKSQLAKGTVYLYFKSKDDLLEKILKYIIDEYLLRVKNIVNSNNSFEIKVEHIIKNSINPPRDIFQTGNVILQYLGMSGHNEKIYAIINDYYKTMKEQLKILLCSYSNKLKNNYDLKITIFLSILDGFFLQRLFYKKHKLIHKLEKNIMEKLKLIIGM